MIHDAPFIPSVFGKAIPLIKLLHYVQPEQPWRVSKKATTVYCATFSWLFLLRDALAHTEGTSAEGPDVLPCLGHQVPEGPGQEPVHHVDALAVTPN